MAEKIRGEMTLEVIGGVMHILAMTMYFYCQQTGADVSVPVIHALTDTIMNLKKETDDDLE